MRQELRLFFVALQFLTRLPVPRWVGFEPALLNASARYFPAVGTLVGVVASAVLWTSMTTFSTAVAAVLSIAATLFLTGAFHEDGLADTCDALGGAVSREKALEIMKDSRIGTYGAVALIVVLSTKASALAALQPLAAVTASIAAHAASRAAPVLLIRFLPYVGDFELAKAKPLARRVAPADVLIAMAWVVLLDAALVWWVPASLPMVVAAVLVVAAVTLASARWLRLRLGGYTGDTLGATQQIAELGVLLTWLAIPRWIS